MVGDEVGLGVVELEVDGDTIGLDVVGNEV